MCLRNERGHLWYENTFAYPPRNLMLSWCVHCGRERPVSGYAINEWQFTKHAVQRALDMAVDPDVLRSCLLGPDEDRPSPDRYPAECRLYSTGRLVLAVNVITKEVITVMWNAGGYLGRDQDDEAWWRD